MDTLIGVRGKDFVIIASEMSVDYSIIRLKADEDKIVELDNDKLIGSQGELADCDQFVQLMTKNLDFLKFKNNGQALGIKATANFVRNELAYAIRHNPYQANLLIGGLNKEGKAELYFIDYLGVMTEVNCAGHGYGSMFTGAIFDRYWHKDITLEQGLDIIQKCITTVKERLAINSQNFAIKVVTKDGIRVISKPSCSPVPH